MFEGFQNAFAKGGATSMVSGSNQKSEAASRFVEGLAIIARTRPTDRVTILGENEVELLLALANRGFVAVNCVGLSDARRVSGGIADIVVAPSVKGQDELSAAAAEAKRTLKQGGMFITGLPDASDSEFLNFLDLLSLFDFTDISKRDDPSGMHLVCCRKFAPHS